MAWQGVRALRQDNRAQFSAPGEGDARAPCPAQDDALQRLATVEGRVCGMVAPCVTVALGEVARVEVQQDGSESDAPLEDGITDAAHRSRAVERDEGGAIEEGVIREPDDGEAIDCLRQSHVARTVRAQDRRRPIGSPAEPNLPVTDDILPDDALLAVDPPPHAESAQIRAQGGERLPQRQRERAALVEGVPEDLGQTRREVDVGQGLAALEGARRDFSETLRQADAAQ